MEIYFLDDNFERQAVLDVFTSLIWTKRYYTFGDFELYAPATTELTNFINTYPYVCRDDDDTVMIIENVEISTNAETGDYYIITGRSLESIIERRIVWNQTTINEQNPAGGVYWLLDNNICRYADEARKIPGFTVDNSFATVGTLKTQITGTNLLEAISTICKKFGFGFKTTVSGGNIVFSCYEGSMVEVTFSKEFDNIITSNYYRKTENYKNVALIAGEGEGTARRRTSVNNDTESGLSRREIYVDARDISSNEGEIEDEEYLYLLATRGAETLKENTIVTGFESEVEPNMTYYYKTDYNLGDIVTVDNGYGVVATPRIIEIIESWSDVGYNVVPTFEEWEG